MAGGGGKKKKKGKELQIYILYPDFNFFCYYCNKVHLLPHEMQ